MMSINKLIESTALRCAIFATFICLISGCVIYQPSSGGGGNGYSSEDIDATTVIVRFQTAQTSYPEIAREYAMYRCTEIALERGYEGFFLLQSRASSVGTAYGYSTTASLTIRLIKDMSEKLMDENGKLYPKYQASKLKAMLEPKIQRQ